MPSRPPWQGAPPRMRADLAEDLRRLGVTPGLTVVVHSSLKSIGWVVGGAEAVVGALVDALGEEGTLVMPAATPDCGDPSGWSRPPPEEWWETLRDKMPAFDVETTPTSMGAIPETFRRWPGTVRSDHPLESICARGPHARTITEHHPLAWSEGRDGPFGRLHDLDASVLLLGVGFNRCTALHYAESLVPNRRTMTVPVLTVQDGKRAWRDVPNVADDLGVHFPRAGEHFDGTGRVTHGAIGAAPSMRFTMDDLIRSARVFLEDVLDGKR